MEHNTWAQDVIAMVDELRDSYDKAGLHKERQSFPKIVVVGNQSSGKSSVLERIVGHDFLPRGTNTVTCMPIELRLHYVSNDANRPRGVQLDQDWVVFDHKKHEIFTDFAKVRDEIQAQFEEVKKSRKTISSVPLILNIYSANVVNITLVDLPGLIAVASDKQPAALKVTVYIDFLYVLYNVLYNLADQYIEDDNTLILLVCPANQDLHNDNALSRVNYADPERKRTLLVLTKLDIIDKGTHEGAVAVLNGTVMRFDLGIVGVINRSQEESDDKLTSEECLKKEQEFFSSEHYTAFKNQSGIDYLCKIVNKVLIDKIKATLPKEEGEIRKMIQKKKKELEKLAKPVAEEDRKKVLTRVMDKFNTDFTADVKGDEKISGTKELNTGARITLLYRELTTKLNAIDPTDNLAEDEINTAWANAMAYRTKISVINTAFGLLIRERIKLFNEPCLTTVQNVCQILKRYLDNCADLKQTKNQFPNMAREIEQVFNLVLDSKLDPTEDRVNDMLKAELDCINHENVDYVSASHTNKQASTVAAINEIFANRTQKANSQCYAKSAAQVSSYANAANPGTANPGITDDSAVLLFGKLINDYFDIVRKKIQDDMRKKINLFLIDAILEGDDRLLNELNEKVNCESRLDELFRESEKTEKFRSETTNAIETLEKALDTIGKVKMA